MTRNSFLKSTIIIRVQFRKRTSSEQSTVVLPKQYPRLEGIQSDAIGLSVSLITNYHTIIRVPQDKQLIQCFNG